MCVCVCVLFHKIDFRVKEKIRRSTYLRVYTVCLKSDK